MAKTILLTQGYSATVSDADYRRVARFNWCAAKYNGYVYAMRGYSVGENRTKTVLLHRFIMGARKGVAVRHLDNDGLNCRRSNLKLALKARISGSNRKRKDSGQPYKGIRLEPSGSWTAYITVGGPRWHIGTFPTAESAALAHDREARRARGKIAHLNFPNRKD